MWRNHKVAFWITFSLLALVQFQAKAESSAVSRCIDERDHSEIVIDADSEKLYVNGALQHRVAFRHNPKSIVVTLSEGNTGSGCGSITEFFIPREAFVSESPVPGFRQQFLSGILCGGEIVDSESRLSCHKYN